MKMKLALFLFSIGLGSSFAYAAESTTNSCQGYCVMAYRSCINYGGDPAECAADRAACFQDCGSQMM
ncbi:hypothetical protein [Rugamonas violacea]|nr:hypothetical protein [Rugamonas sp. CCM 8940]